MGVSGLLLILTREGGVCRGPKYDQVIQYYAIKVGRGESEREDHFKSQVGGFEKATI